MKLKKGVNLGGWLSQCVHQRAHYERFILEEDIRWISERGCDHVRVPIDYEFFETEEGEPKEEHYQILNRLIAWCEKWGLNLILDLHKAAGYDFNEAGKEGVNSLFSDRGLQLRYLVLWERIAKRYGQKENIAFELLNEVVNPEYTEPWNDLIVEAVSVIRNITALTPIIYGGVEWNSVKSIPLLDKPLFENVLFTFHYYEPLLFTHQKAYWVEGMNADETVLYPQSMEWYRTKSRALGLQGSTVVKTEASTMGMEFHEGLLKDALEYAQKLGIPLYCGEFGVIDRAPEEDTVKWFQDILKLFEKYDIGYAIWNYKEKDFGIRSEHYNALREAINIK